MWGGSAEWRLRKSVRRTRLFVHAIPGDEPVGRFELQLGVPARRTPGLRTRGEEEDSGLGVLLSPEVRGHGWIRVAPIAPQFTPTGPVDVDFDLGAEVRIEVMRTATARVDVRRDHRAAAGVRVLTTTPGTNPRPEPIPPQWWFLSPRDWFVPGFTADRDDAMVGLTVSSELGEARVRLANPDRRKQGVALLDVDTFTTFEFEGDSHHAIAQLPPSPPRPFRVEPDPGSVRFALRSRGGRRVPNAGWLAGGRFELPLPPPGEWHLEFDALGEAPSHVTWIGFAPRDSYTFDCRDRLPARIEIRKPAKEIGSIESEVRDPATSTAPPVHRRLPVGAAVSLLVAPGTWTITLDRGASATIDARPGRETIVRID
jgi:hypothetical protein